MKQSAEALREHPCPPIGNKVFVESANRGEKINRLGGHRRKICEVTDVWLNHVRIQICPNCTLIFRFVRSSSRHPRRDELVEIQIAAFNGCYRDSFTNRPVVGFHYFEYAPVRIGFFVLFSGPAV